MIREIAELWTKQMEDEATGIERLILAAAARATAMERDPLLNGRRQSVAALKNHLIKLAEDTAALRRTFRPGTAEVETSVDEELAESVSAERESPPEPSDKRWAVLSGS